MSVSTSFIKWTNHIFPPVVHPFNLQNDGEQTYAEWQFSKGKDTVRLFLNRYSLDDMFLHKKVLDMGCGAAGKSLYYVKCGADHVTGVDIVSHYREEALALAKKLAFEDKFTFTVASACTLPFADNSFDSIIMNDFMEHVSQPQLALEEARRLLTPQGKIFINFPPYYHPFGAHLSDTINMPWVHLFFREKTLVNVYKELVHGLPDEKERLQLKIGLDEQGRECFTYINKMTLKKFKSMLKAMSIVPQYYEEVPLRRYFKVFAKIPLLKEMFVKMAVCVIGK